MSSLNQRRYFAWFLILSLGTFPVLANGQTVYWDPADGGNGHWYEWKEAPGDTWLEAYSNAYNATYQGLPGHLATITSEAESLFIQNNVLNASTYEAAYLGGYQPSSTESWGPWAWVTDESWNYTNWRPGEPNQSSGPGEYLEVYTGWDNPGRRGQWNDIPGTLTQYRGAYIVEYSSEAASPMLRPVATTPPEQFVTRYQPTPSQLRVYSNGGVIDPSKPTVVMTHGWNASADGNWPQAMATVMLGADVDANVLGWDWSEDAGTGINLRLAASRTPAEGDALAAALHDVLTLGGTQAYEEGLHVIGHSLGARVNREAVDMLHLNGFDPQNTHVTILDAAELGDLDAMPWAKSIPQQAGYIDNYVSAFGDLHDEAANVILREGMPITISPGFVQMYEDLIAFHGYPYEWYGQTIEDPEASALGFRYAHEYEGLEAHPAAGSYFVQTLNPLDSELVLDPITRNTAETIIHGRNTLYIAEGGLLALNAIKDGIIGTVGDVTSEIIDTIVDDAVKRALRLTLTESSPAYAYLSIVVPEDAETFSLDFTFNDFGDDDFFSVGLNEELVFLLEGRYGDPGATYNTGMIDISEYQGQAVDLFLGLNSDGISGGQLVVDNFQFFSTSVPEPASLVSFIFATFVLGRRCRRNGRQSCILRSDPQ